MICEIAYFNSPWTVNLMNCAQDPHLWASSFNTKQNIICIQYQKGQSWHDTDLQPKLGKCKENWE